MIINALSYLEGSAARYADKTALISPLSQVTYQSLLNQAQAIGSQLSAIMQGETNQPVVVLIDRSAASVISFMGVVYSGNFYAPIDSQLPQNRIQSMLNSLQPRVILACKNDSQLIASLEFDGQILFFEEALLAPVQASRLAQIRQRAIDTDPLYLMFTSGSTGTPKGVLISHRSVIDLVEQFSDIFGFSSESIFGNQAPFDFDVSTKDIYNTLKNGATMHILPRVLFSFPADLIKYINSAQINTAIWATSALRIVANLKAFEKELPASLQKVMFSGEVMPNKVLNYWRKYLPQTVFVNLYGPTEITCNCTYFMVERPFDEHQPLPIGSPFPNTDIILLDKNDRQPERGEAGEICVRGTSLALGYYNNPAETARAFCQNPLNPHYPQRIYRSGDLGKYNELGELLFLQRKDNQIKHMGHRIELGEIEIAANALDFIDAACCIYDASAEKIVMFYQSPEKCDREVLLGLRQFLPKYMTPNRLVHLEKFPINKNAKIDRIQLKGEFIDEPGK